MYWHALYVEFCVECESICILMEGVFNTIASHVSGASMPVPLWFCVECESDIDVMCPYWLDCTCMYYVLSELLSRLLWYGEVR